MKLPCLSPSLLSADFSDLGGAFALCQEKNAQMVHIDVMDGHFVPPVSYGQPVISSIRKCSSLPFDVHLMIEKPELALDSFADAGADWITFHYEATNHSDLCINKIHAKGKKAGISICPSTPVSVLKEVLPLVDLVLVMSVNPGWGGQKFIDYTAEKITELAKIRTEKNLSYLISVDGGINNATLPKVLKAGADVVVSGSSFFKGELEWN